MMLIIIKVIMTADFKNEISARVVNFHKNLLYTIPGLQ